MGRGKHVITQTQALGADGEPHDPIRAAIQAKEKRKGAALALHSAVLCSSSLLRACWQGHAAVPGKSHPLSWKHTALAASWKEELRK